VTKRKNTRWLVYLPTGIALAFLLLQIAGSGVARAQNLLCASHSLNRDDAGRLKVAARAVVPKPAHVLVTDACVNPGHALGFLETQKILTAEGVQRWWDLICRRDSQEWSCDPPDFKQVFAMSVSVGGVAHPVELSFDKESSLGHARALASRAIEIYLDPTSQLPSCGESGAKEPDSLRAQSNLSPLPSGEKAIHVSVSSEAKDSVDLDDVDIRIDFRSGADAAGSEAVCWWQWVVVT
jgi:hypothetical protein